MFKHKKKEVRVSEEEVRLLEVINELGPTSSQRVHEYMGEKFDYLFLIRCLHRLVEKGFLRRQIVNKIQLYRTSRSYTDLRGYLRNADAN